MDGRHAEYVRAPFLHVWDTMVGHGEHSEDVTSKCTFHIIQINVDDILTHHLF